MPAHPTIHHPLLLSSPLISFILPLPSNDAFEDSGVSGGSAAVVTAPSRHTGLREIKVAAEIRGHAHALHGCFCRRRERILYFQAVASGVPGGFAW